MSMAATHEGTEAWSKWSSLPDDLVRLIADSFLASSDLDHYMCFRAVCPSWRSATDDPRDNASDPCFQPRRWIVLDEVFQKQGELLLLNTVTGRFLHRKLPMLRYTQGVLLDPLMVIPTTCGPAWAYGCRMYPYAVDCAGYLQPGRMAST